MLTGLLIVNTACGLRYGLLSRHLWCLGDHGLLEQAVILQAVPGVERLSVSGMRQHFYSATSPGNTHVVVSTSKRGMSLIF